MDVRLASKLHRHLLDKVGSIVLPIVGEGFGHAEREMRRLAGYLRRDVAAFVSPILDEGTRLEAKLWRLGGSGDEEFSIAIQAEQHNQ